MNTNPPQIDPDDAALWLYAAGELPADEAGPLRQRLTASGPDAARLTAALGDVRDAEAATDKVLSRLDEFSSDRSADRAAALARRAVRQWAAERLANPPAARPAAAGRAWWTYPLSAAAVAALGLILWWGNGDPTPTTTALAPGGGTVFPGDHATQRSPRLTDAEAARVRETAARLRRYYEFSRDKVASIGTLGGALGGGRAGGAADPATAALNNAFATPSTLGLPPLEAEGDLDALRHLRDLTSDDDLAEWGGA